MEKDGFFVAPEFFNLNWDQSVDRTAAATSTAQFESAMSSLVSSPSSNPAQPPGVAENVMIHDLSGRLGPNTPNTSCYSTPLNSPPKLGFVPPASIASFSGYPGFAERAARYSCFDGRSIASFLGQFAGGLPDAVAAATGGKLSRVSSSQSLKPMPGGAPAPIEEASSASGECFSRKRKASGAAGTAKGKGKETSLSSSKNSEEEEGNAKRSKSGEGNGSEKEEKKRNGNGSQKQRNETSTKPPGPPKDYIHVRARRGQATDSHSLAERVRREKIGQRMKCLQDLVPGCNKVTGKAVMLDEIINYVQSLQRQVEFLSMKLATVNPRLEFNMENFLPKDLNQSRGGMLSHAGYPLEAAVAAAGFPFGYHAKQGASLQSGVTSTALEGQQCSVNPLALSMQLPSHDGFVDVATAVAAQIGNFWEDDLQSVVQMGFGQSQEATFSAQSLHGSMTAANMKIEL